MWVLSDKTYLKCKIRTTFDKCGVLSSLTTHVTSYTKESIGSNALWESHNIFSALTACQKISDGSDSEIKINEERRYATQHLKKSVLFGRKQDSKHKCES